MSDGYLINVGDALPPSSSTAADLAPEVVGKPRIVHPNRDQMRLEPRSLNSALPADHRARTLWAATEGMDLSSFYGEIKSVEGGAGRPALDPRVLLALWLYATSEGVGSARQLSRLCKEHDAYRWIAGGLEICHRVLSSFRVSHGSKLDQLLTNLLAALMHAKVVTLRVVAQDGTRVRASAGASSFRSAQGLQKCRDAAVTQIDRLKQRLEDGEDATAEGNKKAAERAAHKKLARVEQAMAELEKVAESRRKNGKKSDPRASTTDPDARVMKMPDGGYRPGFNCQLATDVDSRIIVAARTTNSGGDMGQIEPTVDEIRGRTGDLSPGIYLVDGGYAKNASIEKLEREGIPVYAPVPSNPKKKDPAKRQRKTPELVEASRKRMETEEAKEIYKLRASTIETINGDLKEHRGLRQFNVRGIDRVNAVLLLAALTYNVLRTMTLAPEVLMAT